MNLKQYFHRKKIVHSTQWQPGELVKAFTHKGKRYIRIAFPNRKKYQDRMPVTDVLFEHVTGVRHLPSRFEKWFWSLWGVRARGKFYVIKRKEK